MRTSMVAGSPTGLPELSIVNRSAALRYLHRRRERPPVPAFSSPTGRPNGIRGVASGVNARLDAI
jgi:hypothetical protein